MRARREHPDAFHGTPRSQAQPKLPRTPKAPPAFRSDADLYRILYEDIPAMYFTLDCQGIVLSVNRFGAEQLGYTSEELVGKSVLTVFYDEDQAAVRDQLALLLEQPGQARRWQFRKVRKDGVVIWVEEDARAIHRKDGTIMILVICSDITDLKRADESLRLFRTLLDQATDAIEIMDPATARFIDCNTEAHSCLGYTREEFLSLSVPDIDPNVSLETYLRYMARFREVPGGGSVTLESVHRRKDGSTFPVEVICRLIRLDREYALAVVRDISERKRAEDELLESRQQYKLLVEHATDIIYRTDTKGYFTFVNTTATRLMGYAESDLLGHRFTEFIRQDYWVKAARFYWRQLLRKTPSTYFEFPATTKDGCEIWFGQNVQTLHENGLVVGFQAVTRDITERRRAEDQLKATTQQLETLIQTSPLAIMSLDTEGNTVVRWNRASEQIFGWREEEVLGHPLPNIPPGFEDESDALWNQAVREGTLRGVELQRLRKDGTLISVALWGTVLKDSEGHITDTFGIVEDITDRKRVEKALQSSEGALRRALQEREQLARNLHDNIIQAIYAIGLTVEESQSLARTSPAGAMRKLDQVVASLNRVIREVRGYLAVPAGEQPETLSVDEMISSFKHLDNLMGHANSVCFAMAIAPDAARALTGSQRAQFLYVAQEAMSNSLRHSSASTARVSLACTSRGVRLEIRDNGVGFSLSRIRDGSGGLKNIRLRARKIGANLDIASHPMGGTVVSMEIQAGT